MTDKQSFLDKLNAALVERGISDADIAPYIERFDRFYDRMVSDDAATSRALENIDGIADNIAAQISDRYDEMNRLAERTMTIENGVPKTEDTAPAEESATEGETAPVTGDAPTADTSADEAAQGTAHDISGVSVSGGDDDEDADVKTVGEKPADGTVTPIAEGAQGITDIPAISDAEQSELVFDDQPTAEADIAEITEKAKALEAAGALDGGDASDVTAEPASEQKKNPVAAFFGNLFSKKDASGKKAKAPSKPKAQKQNARLPDYIEEDAVGDTRKFYIIFFCTLPITILLALAGVAAFVGVWVFLALAIVALMASLVGVSAAGAAVSLVGTVYGIIRLFDDVQVGLYEIGLGVLVAGLAMLGGILIYNIAIRLIPFAMRQLYRLFKFVVRKLKELFFYLRKECSRQ